MAVVAPKTIVIRSLPSKSGCSGSASGLTRMLAHGGRLGGAATAVTVAPYMETGRKRKRLTHLSPDERMMRRKLKNRVAAQTARDRKKLRMDELEITLTQLEAENRKLQDENGALLDHTENLTEENLELRERLGLPLDGGVVGGGNGRVAESAALAVSLPKKQVRALYHLATHYLAFCYMISLMCSLGFCSKLHAAKKSSRTRRVHVVRAAHSRIQRVHQRRSPLLRWWGPRQRSWTPSMN